MIDGQTLPSSGTYTILASSQYEGDYGLSLQRTNDPVNATVLSFGQTYQSSLSAIAELDAYTFSGNSGDVVTVRMTRFFPVLELFAPDGSRIAIGAGTTQAVIDGQTLPSTGTFTILASDSYGDDTGDTLLVANAFTSTSIGVYKMQWVQGGNIFPPEFDLIISGVEMSTSLTKFTQPVCLATRKIILSISIHYFLFFHTGGIIKLPNK